MPDKFGKCIDNFGIQIYTTCAGEKSLLHFIISILSLEDLAGGLAAPALGEVHDASAEAEYGVGGGDHVVVDAHLLLGLGDPKGLGLHAPAEEEVEEAPASGAGRHQVGHEVEKGPP